MKTLNANSDVQDQMLLLGCISFTDLITMQEETVKKIILWMKACCPLTPACFMLFILHKSTLRGCVFRLASEGQIYIFFNQLSEI